MDLIHELAVACRRAVGALDGGALILDGPANLQRGWEAAGGWLALSPDWLAFTPHRVNWRVGRLLVPTSALRRAWTCWTWVFGLVPVFPNSVAVETAGGRVYRFVVVDRQAWVAALRCLIAEPPTAADRGGM
jgi:hypothetical protein